MTVKQWVGRRVLPRLPVTRFVIEVVRLEARAFAVRVKNRVVPSRRRRLAQLRRAPELRLNIACGPQVLPGMLNIDLHAAHKDVVELDCRRRLPFADGSILGIRAEHFVEHLEPREELSDFLQECFRALVPSGVLRIIVPDAERYLRAYCENGMDGFRELGVPIPFPPDLPTRMDVVNHTFHQWHEHRWGYDFETLEHRVRRAGFTRIERSSFERSLDAELGRDREEHARYSLYVDAVK